MKSLWWLTGIVFILYLFTLTPGLPPIDVGEFVGCALTFGIPHPTGYPIYLLAIRLFAMLPLSPVTALSLLSALSMVFATYFLARSAKEESPTTASWWMTLFFPVTALVWNAAIRPEVYAFNTLFIAGAFWAGLNVWRGNARSSILLGMFTGFAAVTHLSSGYFLLPLWLGLLLRSQSRRLLFSPLPWFAAILPVTAHFILPLRQLTGHPPYTWGDLATMDGWWRHISGWQYRIWLFESAEAWNNNITTFLKNWSMSVGIFAVAGFYFLFKEDWRRGFWLLLMFVFPVIMVSGYQIPDLDTYYLPAYLLSIWLGCFAVSRIPLEKMKSKVLLPAVIGMFVFAFAVWQYPSDTRTEDRRQLAYTNALCATLPSPCVLFSSDWEIVVGPLQAMLAQKQRPDLAVIDLELMRRSWYIESLMRRYPKVVAGCENELNELIPALRMFERKEDISGETLERLYRGAIYALMVRNVPRAAVCMTYEVQVPSSGYDKLPLFTVPLPLFSRLQTSNVNYVADLDGLKLDPIYGEPVGTRVDNRLREKIGVSLLQRATFLFKQGYREEAFEAIRLAKKAKPPQGTRFWLMLDLIEREEGHKY